MHYFVDIWSKRWLSGAIFLKIGFLFVIFAFAGIMRTIVTLLLSIFAQFTIVAQTNIEQLGELPDGVLETSGLIFYNGKLITHNDSGNTAQLFEIDTVSREITRTVSISNVENVDWEDMAQDTDYIYIGDFGNNLGTRQDLAIYRIAKSAYDQADTVPAEAINFSYEDQTDFSDNGNSDWDAEALFVLGDRLIILTKQWSANGTAAYSLPKVPGTQLAQKRDGFDVQGLVTAATYNPMTKILYILGYSTLLEPFVFRVEGAGATVVFGGTVTKLDTTSGFGQTEGLTYAGDNRYFASSELFVNSNPPITLPSSLFAFNTDDATDNGPGPEPDPNPEISQEPLILFRQPGSHVLGYQLNVDKPVLGLAIFDTSGQRVGYAAGPDISPGSIDVSTLTSAVYYLSLYLGDEILSKPFAKY